MKTIEELLKNLSRPEVLEFGLVTNRLPSVNIGGKFEPVDDEAPSNERLMQMLVTMGGARYVDSLSDKPVQWTTKLEGVGVIAVAAILRKDIVQARFTVAKRDASVPAPSPSRSPAATTQPQASQKPPVPPAPKPAAAQSNRSIPAAQPSPTPPQAKPAAPAQPAPAATAAPATRVGPASTPMTAAKATAQMPPQVVKNAIAQASGAASARQQPAAPPAPSSSSPVAAAAPAAPAAPQPVPPPPEEEWDDDDEPTLQTLSPPVVPPHMMPPSGTEAKAKPARRPDETITQIDDSTLKNAAKQAQEKTAADRAAAEKAASEKAAADKAAADKAAAEKAAADKAAADKATAEKAAADKAAADKAAAEKAAADKAAAEKAAADKAAADKAAAEKVAAEKAAAEKAAAEKAAAEKAAAERAAAERAAAERAAEEAAAEAARLEEERVAAEAAEAARVEEERQAAEAAEAEARAAEARAAEERAAQERATQERVARDRAAAQEAARQRQSAQTNPQPARRISTPTDMDASDVEITTAHPGTKKVIDADADADGDTVSLPGGLDVARASQQAATQAKARGPVPTTTAPNIPEKDRPRVDAAAAIDSFLAMAVSAKATDLVIVAGRPVLLRVASDLLPRTQTVSAEQVERIAKDIVPARLRETLEKEGACDFAVEHLTHGRFRVNVSRQRTGVKLTLRVIAKELPTLASLGLPDAIADRLKHESGLIVVAGPAGHGKSSTLAALVDMINRDSAKHVATIEEPIEHVHPRKKGLVSQRDVGLHTRTKARAFHSALRSDPDVVVVHDLRDADSVRLALLAAEGGRLVLGTMNAPSAILAAERILRMFAGTEQSWARTALASTLRLIIGQQLVPSADRTRLHAAVELLPASVAVWAAIKSGRLHELAGGKVSGKGVVHLDASLAELVRSQKVTLEVAKHYAESPVDLDALVRRS